MPKKLFVLFVAVIFVSSVGYIIIKDRKIIEEQRVANQEKTYETQENEESNNYFYEESEYILNKEESQDSKSQITEDDELLGTITIEKINLVAPVKEGSSEEILSNYVGHIEETSNFNGNIGLAAHNRGDEKTYFQRLNELVEGDKIIYESKFGTREYKVKIIKEILDTDWSMLENTEENKLTLITCINNKINLRLCVQAVEI